MKVNLEVQHICLPRNDLRGVPYYIINLLNNLVRRGTNDYSISFFDYGKERNNRKYIDEYISARTLRSLSIYECNTLSYAAIIKAQRNNDHSSYDHISYSEYTGTDADVIHIPFSMFVPANTRVQTVVTVHDVIPILDRFKVHMRASVSASFENGIKLLENRDDITVITDSTHSQYDLLRYTKISADRIFAVPLSYDKSVHYPDNNPDVLAELGLPKGTPYLFYISALDPRKAISDIIDAFSIVREHFGELKLVLAGTPITREFGLNIMERVSCSGYADDIILPGFVSDKQKRALMSGAEVFLFPSEYEGFGLPVLEAMACGAPVITTNVSSLPEVGGDAAVYVEPNAPEQLAYEIERLLNSEPLRREYSQKGLSRALDFSWDETARMTEEVYKIAYDRR